MQSGNVSSAQQMVEHQILAAAKMVEQQIDDEMNRIESLDDKDLERIKQGRIKELKERARKKEEWVAAGHGVYQEIPDERAFFAANKNSKNIICQFYLESTFRCKIFDKHLALLAPKHLECRMVKMNAEKAPFLAEKLNIRVIPTILIVVNEKVADKIVGFDDLGGHDEFSTKMLEWRLAQSGVIDYDGDLMTPPDSKKSKPSILGYGKSKKTIRGTVVDDSDESD